MRVRYTAEAQADPAAISDYLEERNPQTAVRTKAAIRQVISGLPDFPDAGPASDIQGVRVLLAGGDERGMSMRIDIPLVLTAQKDAAGGA